MTMHTPTAMQGQVIERSYGWANGSLYRRTLDHSDGSVAWAVADDASAEALPEGWEATESAPAVAEWTPCSEPR